MAYYADKVTNINVDASRDYIIVTGEVIAGYETVQMYIAGVLVGYDVAVQGKVTFTVPTLGSTDPVFLLSVSSDSTGVDYWSSAFPEAAAAGNRIHIEVPTDIDVGPDWRWRVTLDGVKKYENNIYPTGDGAGGWGVSWGEVWGYGPFGSGWGNSWGTNWGYGGGIVLGWTSEPLYNGTYTVAVVFLDQVGNVSSTTSNDVTIETYARPAEDLAVVSYDNGTDTLGIAWTESEDI